MPHHQTHVIWVVISCDPDPEPHQRSSALRPVHIEQQHNDAISDGSCGTGAREWADIQMGWRAKRNGTSFISNQATTEATGGMR